MYFSRPLLALLVLAGTLAPGALAEDSIESLFTKARVRIDRGDVKGAMRLAEKVRSIDPDSADAFFLAGSVIMVRSGAITHKTTGKAKVRRASRAAVTSPVVWWSVGPAYPELDRVARIESKVVLEATISQDGTIAAVEMSDGGATFLRWKVVSQ